MTKNDHLTRHSETSEKALEKYLCEQVTALGGLPLKYSSGTQTGYPDRLLLFSGGLSVWVEMKGKGGAPTRLQIVRIQDLREMGFIAEIVKSREQIDELLEGVKEIIDIIKEGLTDKERLRLIRNFQKRNK